MSNARIGLHDILSLYAGTSNNEKQIVSVGVHNNTAIYKGYTTGLQFSVASYLDGTQFATVLNTSDVGNTQNLIITPKIYDQSNNTTPSVDGIEANAFRSKASLKYVYLPETMRSIGRYAFYNCSNITQVDIIANNSGKKITIGNSAFEKCTNISIDLTTVDLIRYHAFENCSNFRGDNTGVLRLSPGITIESSAFLGCTGLGNSAVSTSVTNHSILRFTGNVSQWCSNTSFKDRWSNPLLYCGYITFNNSSGTPPTTLDLRNLEITAFNGSSKFNGWLGTDIQLPRTLTQIGGANTFLDCVQLRNISVPFAGNKSEWYASQPNHAPFGGWFGTTVSGAGKPEYPDKSTAVTQHWFRYDSLNQSTFYIPKSLRRVTTYGNGVTPPYAFENCSMLTDITLGYSSTYPSIPDYAFYNCTNLQNVSISKPTSIGSYVFTHCRSLAKIIYDGTKTQWNSISKGTDWNTDTGNYTIYCTDGTISK